MVACKRYDKKPVQETAQSLQQLILDIVSDENDFKNDYMITNIMKVEVMKEII